MLLAATLALVIATGCTGSPESQASRDPNAPTFPGQAGETLPLAPDVDPCQLSPSVIGILAGLATEAGTFTSTGDAEGQCRYTDQNGSSLVVTVDTSGGSSHYDDVDQTTPGDDIASVGDEAFWNDPTLHVLSDGRYWSFTLENNNTDALRRQTVAIAVAQALEL